MKGRAVFGKWDIWVFAGLTVISLLAYAFFAALNGAGYGQISVNGNAAKILNLSEDGEFLLENPKIRFEVKDGAVAFTESSCPDKICVKSGYLRYPGQMAVCLPNGVSLVITVDGGVDAVAH